MDEKKIQQAFVQFLAQKYQLKSQQELEAKIQELGEDGLKAEYAEFQKVIAQQQSRKMMFGAKLNYIKGLKGQCPQGYKMRYYKVGGVVCPKCEAIKNQVSQVPQDPIKAFKCGRKMKKKACGGTVKEAKCSTKVEMDKCGKKMKKKACGGNIKKAQKGTNLPTAPNASTIYKNGTLEYVGRPGFVYGNDDLIITAPNGRTIQRKIVNWPPQPKPGEIFGTDTIYTETPDHTFWVVPSPRKAQAGSKYDPRTGKTTYHKYGDADIMKRRWQEAQSVSKDKRNK